MSTDGMMLDRSLSYGNALPTKATWRELVSLTKVGITVANVMATFAGMWAGSQGHVHFGTMAATLIGTALIVASGASLNNYVDRDIDGSMSRTKKRVVANGKVSADTAFTLGLTLGVIGMLVLVFLVNLTAALLGFIGLIFYGYIYSVWLKRTTTLNTVLGGIPGAIPPLIGWAAATGGTLDLAAWAMFCTFFLWQPPHFLPLALKRVEEYRSAGVPMLPVVRGATETKRQIAVYAVALLPVSLVMGITGEEGPLYWIPAGVLGLIFAYRGIQGLYAKDDIAWANKIFGFSLIYLMALCLILVLGTFRFPI